MKVEISMAPITGRRRTGRTGAVVARPDALIASLSLLPRVPFDRFRDHADEHDAAAALPCCTR
jgi:hypothetical protein